MKVKKLKLGRRNLLKMMDGLAEQWEHQPRGRREDVNIVDGEGRTVASLHSGPDGEPTLALCLEAARKAIQDEHVLADAVPCFLCLNNTTVSWLPAAQRQVVAS
jgi:3-oxoacyl-[acyl-carrier-protein] synthase III